MIDHDKVEKFKHSLDRMISVGAKIYGDGEPEYHLAHLSIYWFKDTYESIPDHIKDDREFKNEINKLKLKNGPFRERMDYIFDGPVDIKYSGKPLPKKLLISWENNNNGYF